MVESYNDICHLNRWIKASFLIALRVRSKGKKVYVEGDDRTTNKETEFIEFRLDGPYVNPNGTRGEYYAYVECNLVCTSGRDSKNSYAADNLRGVMAHMLNTDICVLRTGNEKVDPQIDDGTTVGTMQLMKLDRIKQSNFGQIDPAAQVFQSTAEAHYEMYFVLR